MRLTGFSYVGRIENLRDLVYYKLYGKDNFWFPFEVSDMVKNNIELDVKTKCIEQGKTQVNLAEEIETTKAWRTVATGMDHSICRFSAWSDR